MNASMQIHKLGFQVMPARPRYVVPSTPRRISFKLAMRCSQQIDRHVLK